MNNLLIYFIKSGIAMALFFGVYKVFMEKETNYSLNRFYLIGTIILSLILPILPLEKIFTLQQNINMPAFFINLDEQGLASTSIGVSSASDMGFQLSGALVARIVYICGIGILLLTFCIQLIRLILLNRVWTDQYGPMKVISVKKDIGPFSILNWIFVNHEIMRNPKLYTILDHEYAHYRNFHYLDILLLEFITIFQWFNPFTWLYVRSLKEIHEYQADDAVLRGGEECGTYQALLVNQLTGTEVFRLANGFSSSLTKKRMIMMTKIKSKKGVWLKALLAIPVLAILLIAFSANSNPASGNQESYTVSGKVVEAGSDEPLPDVAVIWQGTTTGTVTDMNGNFSLEVNDKKAKLVYSFVGFKTASTSGAGSDLIIKMERKTFDISEDWVETQDEKADQSTGTDPVHEPERHTSDEVFYIVENMPKFQGKDFNASKKYIQEHVEYPQIAKQNKIEGKVHVQFVVSSKGEVRDAIIVRGVDPSLDKAALKAINSMPAWEPGSQRGKPVAVQFTMPVEFKLGEE